MLLSQKMSDYEVPFLESLAHLNLRISQKQYLGVYDQKPCYAISLEDKQSLPSNFSFKDLRTIGEYIHNDDIFLLASRAKQLLFWDKRTMFCGQCGSETFLSEREPAKVCPECDALFYPQISPAIMVLITRGHEILLARSSRFPEKMYSVLAGFVEPGETVEHAVMREVREEVGLCIKNIQYVASQPWAFPSNLMLGFTAEYKSGEIKIDTKEIEHAQWYTANNLPSLPKKVSLSRYLIDMFLRL